MLKKSSETSQLNIFTSPKTLFSGNSQKMYEDEHAWLNQFRKQITMRTDENIFHPLYCVDNGTPNASVRVMVEMMVLKEAEGLSDQKIFENCRFNMLVRSTIGLHKADDPLPTEVVDTKMNTFKYGAQKWRIPTEKGFHYLTQKEIDTYMIRKQIAETPIEILQFRNNVEATIFQLGYHYPNAKSRYRGEIKHQMWANIRCLWVKLVRILNYIKQLCQRSLFFRKYAVNWLFAELYLVIKSSLTAILPNSLPGSENIPFSFG